MVKRLYHIAEYGVIRALDTDSPDFFESLKDLRIPKSDFESLFEFILTKQAESEIGERPFTLYQKGKTRYIKVKNYVGLIETTNGTQLEILPKLFIHNSPGSVNETKAIFLKMLRHLRDSPFLDLSHAHIDAKKDFPILEVFIQSYASKVENVLQRGIQQDYVTEEENLPSLRGKLLPSKNLKTNLFLHARLYCEFDSFSPNIAANRIIKTTCVKLLRISRDYMSIQKLNNILRHLEDVEVASNINLDLQSSKSSSRLFKRYNSILAWSELFLLNKGFTNFEGSNQNLSILFPMEKVFEDYVAYLLKKYLDGFQIKTQDKSYFLVERHRDRSMFRLKPDVVLREMDRNHAILDTKWKIIDENSTRNNYNISQADMYQLYAYGQKYKGESSPKLVMLYPSNQSFQNKLESFIYDGDLTLEVIPFNFSLSEQDAILEIAKSLI